MPSLDTGVTSVERDCWSEVGLWCFDGRLLVLHPGDASLAEFGGDAYGGDAYGC